MLSTTRGIVLSHINYSETSVIAKVYTENYGLQSYILKGIRKSKLDKALEILTGKPSPKTTVQKTGTGKTK